MTGRRLVLLALVLSGGLTAQPAPDEVRRVFAEGRAAEYAGAAEAYLERLGAGRAGARDLAQLALVLPEALAARVARPDPALGADLAAWWRRQDPRPASPQNERAIEHLLRVAAAEVVFAADRPSGLDARGETFVRFGSPARRRVIDFEGDLFIARAIREEPSVRRSDFPPNEAWHYPTIGPDVYFVFARRRGAYVLVDPLDLIPRALQAGGISRQTEGRARLLGQALRWLYKDLQPYSAEFRNRLLTLDSAVGGDGTAFDGNTALVLQSELQRARLEDADARDDRDAALPPALTRLDGRPFGIRAQAAVFLDGGPEAPTASLWVGWVQTARGLAAATDSLAQRGLTPDRFLVEVSTVRFAEGYRRDAQEGTLYLLGRAQGDTEALWTVAEGIAPGRAAAVEWGLYPADAGGQALLASPTGVEVLRVDTVGVAWAGDVGLSGLLAVDAAAAVAEPEIDRRGPFPPARPVPSGDGGVALYYELYRRGDAATEVEIEVRAVRSREGRPLRRGSDLGVGTASRLRLVDWQTPQFVLGVARDLDGADRLDVEVTVVEVATGATATQAVTFDLRSP